MTASSAVSAGRMSPPYWALATFLVPVVGAVGYLAWLVVSSAHLAESTRAEELVRGGIYAGAATVLLFVRRPWARAVAVATAVALALWLVGAFEFEVSRNR